MWLCHVIFPSNTFLSEFIHFAYTFSFNSCQSREGDGAMLLCLVVIYGASLDYHLKSAAPCFITPLRAHLKRWPSARYHCHFHVLHWVCSLPPPALYSDKTFIYSKSYFKSMKHSLHCISISMKSNASTVAV